VYYVCMSSFFAKALYASVFIFICFFSVIDFAFAQNNYQYYFKETQLDTNKFNPGEVVSGYFTIENKTRYEIDNLQYQIEFVALTQVLSEIIKDTGTSTQPQTPSKKAYIPSDPIIVSEVVKIESIEALEENRNRFSFKLPNRVPAGDIGIVIQLYDDAFKKREKEIIPLEVGGARAYTLFSQNSLITINDDEGFGVLDGPIVQKDESAQLFISVQNTSENAVQVMPTFEYFTGGVMDGTFFESDSQEPFVLEAKRQKAITYTLPISSREPGEYTIRITHKDSNGNNLTTPLYVRYLVGDIKPVISTVVYNTFDLNKEDEFTATISFTPPPFDIRSSINSKVNNRDIRAQIILFDKKTGEKKYRTEIMSFGTAATLDVVFPNTLTSGEYIVQTYLLEETDIIQTRKDDIVIIGKGSVDVASRTFFEKFKSQIIVAMLLFIFLVVAAMVLLQRQRKEKHLKELLQNKMHVPQKFEVD